MFHLSSIARALLIALSCGIATAQPLDLGARVQALPDNNRFSLADYHVWCGAPVKGPDGKYHLFYSRWPKKYGFAPAWALHSEIAYAVADYPQGPYRPVTVILPARGINPATGEKYWDADVTHNANAFYHNGQYCLFYMGNRGDNKSYSTHRNNQRIGVAVASRPEGPWQRLDHPIIDVSSDEQAFDSLCVTNPAACVMADGKILLIYKAVARAKGKIMGGQVRYGAAIATNVQGPYQKTPGKIFESDQANSSHWMLAEDPFIWFSRKYGQRYYAVTRDVVGQFSGAHGGICLFESGDGLHWRAAAQPKILSDRFALSSGALSPTKLERPSLLIENDEPTYLFGAVNGYPTDGSVSYNVQIPLAPYTSPSSSRKP